MASSFRFIKPSLFSIFRYRLVSPSSVSSQLRRVPLSRPYTSITIRHFQTHKSKSPYFYLNAIALSLIHNDDGEDQANDGEKPKPTSQLTREEVLYQASQRDIERKKKAITSNSSIGKAFEKVIYYARIYIYEPLSTCFRFIHLFVLFGPVLLSFPMVLFGSKASYGTTSPDKITSGSSRERSGARLWYKFLTWAMEQAGPSFIKVRFFVFFMNC